MSKRFLAVLFGMMLIFQTASILAQSDPNDREGTKDPPYFSRMKNFHIDQGDEKEFNNYDFSIGSEKKEAVEGHYYWVHYWINEGTTEPSAIQVVRNYVNAAKAAGGRQLYSWEDGGAQYATIKVVKDKAELWLEVGGSGRDYAVIMIEKQLMNQDVVADASSLANSLKETGKVAVYGIYFDTDKSTLKPESTPALEEISKMLKSNASMKVYVVGHTDNAGTFDHNIKLSKDRADSVVKELTTKYSIAASRLIPYGAGPTAPVASNSTEEGKAKNRRVELVQQ
jgi:OmpA-OmpF porin, OOP family